jgi:rod shape-determining protein MreD
MRIFCTFIISLLIAAILEILPLPLWLQWLWPAWVGVVFIYWLFTLPNQVCVGTAFIVGIFLDVLRGTPLGEHAMVLVIIAYIITKLHMRLRVFPRWQQTIVVLLLMLIYQGGKYIIQTLTGQSPTIWLYFLLALTSALVWPVVYNILARYQRRYKKISY